MTSAPSGQPPAQKLEPLTFPLAGTRLIEASAGTGKTYTIAALYLRLVLGHDQQTPRPLSPEEILVVTFTKAATEELKDRIRHRLVEGAACFRGLVDGDPYLKALKADFDPAEHARCALQLDLAAQLMDNAAIHTIHGWCQRMLREHAFDSGALFETEMETDSSALLDEAVRDYWRTQFYPRDRDTLQAVRQLYGSPEALQKAVRPLLGLASQGALPAQGDPFALVAQRQQAVARCKSLWQREWPQFCEQFEQALAQGWVKKNLVKPEQLNRLQQWLEGEQPLPLDGRNKLLDRFTPEKMQAALTAAGKKHEGTVADSPLLSALESLIRELEKLDLKPALLTDAAVWVQQRVAQAKQRLAQLDFDDLIQHLGAALKRPEQGDRLAALIRTQFPVALIDEFQDTDPTQYGIFQKLYLNQPGTALLMIGDPKQAIYAFRGADIHTYLQAREDTAGRHYTLDTNYRSTQAMVSAANALFTLGHHHPRNTFLYGESIPFEPVKANGKGRQLSHQGESHPALTLWWDPCEEGVWNKQSYLARQAKGCADRITELLNGAEAGTTGFVDGEGQCQALQPSDIAILVRDFTEARAVRQALAGCGVRSVYLSDKDSVFASEQAQDLVFLLEAVAQPERESAVKAALATRSLGWDWARIDALNNDELAWEALLEQFRQLRLCWQQQGVLPMIRAVLEQFDVAGRALAAPGAEQDSGDERSLTNLLHLAELLQSVSSRFDGELALIRYLAEQCQSGGELGDDQILRLESDSELVKVVTIHKSKGLEYPVVFLPFILGYRQASAQDKVLFYRDAQGHNTLTFDADDEALELADYERLAEDIRLLYVAMTRPSFACYLGLAPVKLGQRGKRDQPNTHLGALGCLLGGGAAQDSDALLTALQGLAQQSGISLETLPTPRDARYQPGHSEQPLLPALPPPASQPPHWWIASYSAMLRGMGHGSDPAADPHGDQLAEMAVAAPLAEGQSEPLAGTIHAFPKGAAPGTFLHDLFEWAAEQGRARWGAGFADIEPGLMAQEINERCDRYGYGDQAQMLLPWFEQALTVSLPLPGADPAVSTQPSLTQLDQVQAEMEFWLASHRVDTQQVDKLVTEALWPGEPRPALQSAQLNGMLKGFIDLTFRLGERYYVADYKSNFLGPDEQAYTPQAMKAAMLSHRYDLQAALYALALHRLLSARLPDYDFDRHVGGALYLFLRGMSPARPGNGVLALAPDRALIEALDTLFREVKDAG
ncbi:exodeoxyribonuclease V subunit beta [Ferrimonas marina]|uniref:exodeoxyribonuclease V subunit beta n=1 Tax=Ferrimonas marina TaxID=299255 RepID=UPI00190EED73|nr:exodeoxyribonuclease V subunit beta [Ferrimonas marina]